MPRSQPWSITRSHERSATDCAGSLRLLCTHKYLQLRKGLCPSSPGNQSAVYCPRFTKRFNRCCKLARESHIKEVKAMAVKWSTRKKIERTEYLECLAMWQSGSTLNEIQGFMRTKGMHVGDSRDKSAISYAIRKTAQVIQVAPRPGNRV